MGFQPVRNHGQDGRATRGAALSPVSKGGQDGRATATGKLPVDVKPVWIIRQKREEPVPREGTKR
jgi:hypothetical protein